MATNFTKTYDPKLIEADWYKSWEDAGHFAADPASLKTPYTITCLRQCHWQPAYGACANLTPRPIDPLSPNGGTMYCGSPDKIMPALPRRWSLSASLPSKKLTAAISAARPLSIRFGNGRLSRWNYSAPVAPHRRVT